MPRISASAAAFADHNGSTRHLIRPPENLSAEAKKEFLDIVCGSPANHFLPQDIAMLSLHVRAVIGERVADKMLSMNPVGGDKVNPWLRVWEARMRAVTTTARRLNINPAGRKSKSTREPESVSAYDKLHLVADEGFLDDDTRD